ncbi:MAG: zinc-binding alcohol dehydrogenase family protein [Acidimicrobiales bacterium]|nr:zinc-binding alcohol dehydrogenase family protein [Acidimicrobiales bacterium]
MQAWIVDRPGPAAGGPMNLVERAVPEPGPTQVLVEVRCCGVCRTDLHLAEGDLAPKRHGVTPGHEVVGTVAATGSDAHRFRVGDRIGIAWLGRTCGRCRFCRRGSENLCTDPRFTGWDVDGGFAGWTTVEEQYAYVLPGEIDDVHVAPLLCAGIIGYRALRRAAVPPGGRLGIYGFGASAHITAQIAITEGVEVHVLTRSAAARRLATELGAASVGDATDPPAVPLDAAILFAPVGDLVPVALEALDRGGTLAIAGIHLSDIPRLGYQRHLFQERVLRSVTANTREDGLELLEIAARTGIRTMVTPYAFAHADRALADLAAGRITGAAVIQRPGG